MGGEVCCCRLSEVLDWEEGGRTEQQHLEHIFSKEKTTGERRVLTVARQVGQLGSVHRMFMSCIGRMHITAGSHGLQGQN